MQRLVFVALVAWTAIFVSGHAHAAKRVALVIGNSTYQHAQKLTNPENDAKLIASVLRKKGLEVLEHKNLGFKAMKRAARTYSAKLRKYGKDTVGLIFFAGHGLQAEGQNFLVPIDAKIENEGDIDIETISAQSLMSGVRLAGNRLNIIVLDACRNNPYRGLFRSSSRGFARMDAPVGSLLAFSTAPGTVAADGDGRNSPYSAALAQAISEPGLKIEDVFKRVRERVYTATGGKQVPWESSSVFGDFFFSDNVAKGRLEPAKVPVSSAASTWKTIQGTTSVAILEAFIKEFPTSIYVSFAEARINELKPKAKTAPADTQLARIAPRQSSDVPEKTLGRYGMTLVPVLEFMIATGEDLGVMGDTPYVADVAPGSSAAKIGITKGDLILYADGENVRFPKDFDSVIERAIREGKESVVVKLHGGIRAPERERDVVLPLR